MPCIIETLEYANEVEQLARQRIDEIHRSEQEIKERKIWSITKILDRYEKKTLLRLVMVCLLLGCGVSGIKAQITIDKMANELEKGMMWLSIQ